MTPTLQTIIYIISFAGIALAVFAATMKRSKQSQPSAIIEKGILEEEVLFYQKLGQAERERFLSAIRRFLERVKVTGVRTEVSDTDRVLVAAAAVIPIFAFPGWEYRNINEVILYPDAFSEDYRQEGEQRHISGMVGNGAMERVMLLSKHDLQQGFRNRTDKHNTPIHEFVHLVDKADGETDGLPDVLMSHRYSVPWLKLVHHKIQMIREGNSDINPYAATNEAEFLAVVAEYFFERPKLMKEKHPLLYEMLDKMFKGNGK